ncbi:hypothetical protein F4560_008728 [Saccharothrix ecbatanensis]|uniref:Uncharacterized protein n=1 Tax=Saccharothrix ecbatanensis TaxID=1105145 RepID=A0A7W9M677_9PSEU|nr:hypothetical protein [Saccharothrix ecbatanensis]MBB5808960.1 hypothetical protein [Saccharothrix ecbatanensis]
MTERLGERLKSLGLGNHDENAPEVDRLLEERVKLLREFRSYQRQVHRWTISLGKLRFSRPVSSQGVAWLFLVWHLTAGVAGVVITIIWSSNRALGIALVVGSLFGFGSFLSQVWGQAIGREKDYLAKIWADDEIEEMRVKWKRVREIEARLREIV